VPPYQYVDVIKSFDYEKLYIVTDASTWEELDKKDVSKMQKKRVKSSRKKHISLAAADNSVKYMHDLVTTLAPFNPIIVHHSNYMKDFDFIRSFDKIIIHNSTFSWWAAVLSQATRVGVYEPWKPAKGKRNKNLGHTNYPGWFGWGKDERATYWR
jgi:hypothetical protein